GPAPVLAGEGEQGQRLDAMLQAEVHGQVDRARAGTVPDHARPAPALRPAAVAVHDDGQVPGHLVVAGDWCVLIRKNRVLRINWLSPWNGLVGRWHPTGHGSRLNRSRPFRPRSVPAPWR